MKIGTMLGFITGTVATCFIMSKMQPSNKQKGKDLKEKIIKILD